MSRTFTWQTDKCVTS